MLEPAISCAGPAQPDDASIDSVADATMDAKMDADADATGDTTPEPSPEVLVDTALDTESSDDADAINDAVAPDTTTVRRCNGLAELCDRRLDQIAFVTTHNAMANETDGFAAPNQKGSVSQQLADGVRAFMLDIHLDNREDPPPSSKVYLCHGLCALGIRPLKDTLGEIRTFLEQNPDEFVAIIFESYVAGGYVELTFDDAEITNMLAELSPDDEMPTLAALIDSGKRILVLTDYDGGGFPGYLPVWEWAWDNDWDNKVPEDLNCDVNRGSGSNRFFILNHFLTNPVASEALAAQINYNPFFQGRVTECHSTRGHMPNFVTVDFYDVGNVLDVVNALNVSEVPTPQP